MKEIKEVCWFCKGSGYREKKVFTEEDLLKIKYLKSQDFSLREIARGFGVHHEYIRQALGKAIDKI